MQGGTDQEGSDTDEDESSSPRAESTSGEEEDNASNEDVFYDAAEVARSDSLQASRSGSMSLPAFEGEDSASEGVRYSRTLLCSFALPRASCIPPAS